MKSVTYTGPTPDSQPLRLPNTTPAGTLHTPDPAAVARLKALLGHGQPSPAKRNGAGDVDCNLKRASVVVNERRRKVLPPEEIAAVKARRAAKEGWKPIAADYGMSHTTLMRVMQRDAAEQRRMEKNR